MQHSRRQLSDIARLRRAAQQLRNFSPDKSAEIERALAEVDAGKRDLATISVGVTFRLEKFDGDYQQGLTPTIIIEGKG